MVVIRELREVSDKLFHYVSGMFFAGCAELVPLDEVAFTASKHTVEGKPWKP